MIVADYNITVNGSPIESPAPFEKDGVMMIPLRALAEALGFNVEWQGETSTIILTKGPVYITMNALKDGYTFSKTAPMLLGTAPILDSGVTFVPSQFVVDVLGGAYRTNENGVIDIFDNEHKNIALIESVNAEEKQVTVNDIVMGKVILNISDETLITDEQGTVVAFDKLTEGNTLKITYSEAMTRSLPPQNTPDVIVVLSASPAVTIPSHEEVAASDVAVIQSVKVEENAITVNDAVRGEVVLVVSDETDIKDIDGNSIKADALKDGMTVEIVYGEAMTMSIPPINNPVSIKVISNEPTVKTQPVEQTPAYTE